MQTQYSSLPGRNGAASREGSSSLLLVRRLQAAGNSPGAGTTTSTAGAATTPGATDATRAAVASPSPPQSLSLRGIRVTLRSSIGMPLSVEAPVSSSNGNGHGSGSSGWSDPQQRQLACVVQCVADCREALLLAREWAAHAGSQEGASVRLMRCVAEWEEKQQQQQQCDGTEPSSNGISRAAVSSDATVSVTDQVLCLLSNRAAAERSKRVQSAASASGHLHGAISSSSSGSDDDDESDDGTDGSGREDSDSDSRATVRSRNATAAASTAAVPECIPQFLRFRELFSSRGAVKGGGGGGVSGYPNTISSTMAPLPPPPLASEQLRYAPLLRDMQVLARHLLLPLDVTANSAASPSGGQRQQQRRLWLFVDEDVSHTLEERLFHHRVALGAVDGQEKEGEGEGTRHTPRTAHASHATPTTRAMAMPAAEVERLWGEMWGLLGAAWRRRGRVLGHYSAALAPAIVAVATAAVVAEGNDSSSDDGGRGGAMRLTSTRALPPCRLHPPQQQQWREDAASLEALLSLPPGAGASPHHRDRYARHVSRFWRGHANEKLRRANLSRRAAAAAAAASATATDPMSNGTTAAAGQSAWADGDDGTGLFSSQPYEEQDGIAFGPFSATRIGINSGGGTTGKGAVAAFVMRDPLAAVWRALRCVYTDSAAVERCVPLFDPDAADGAMTAVAPYMAPELYAEACRRRHQQQQQHYRTAPCHSFSDDAWNLAVVVLEAALAGFSLRRDSHICQRACHEDGLDDPPSPPLPVSSSVYADTVAALVQCRGVPVEAAHNFLYCAINALAELSDNSNSNGSNSEDASDSPRPERLAAEWWAHLSRCHGAEFIAELCECGLRWRRGDRWAAFHRAHSHSSSSAMPLPPPVLPSAAASSPASGGSTVGGTPADGDGARLDPSEPLSPLSPQFSSVAAAASGGGRGSGATPFDSSVRPAPLASSSSNGLPTVNSTASLDCGVADGVTNGSGSGGTNRAVRSSSTAATAPTNAVLDRLAERAEGLLDSLRLPMLPVLPKAYCTGTSTTTGPLGLWSVGELWVRWCRWRAAAGRAATPAAVAGPQQQAALFAAALRLAGAAIIAGANDKETNSSGGDAAALAALAHPLLRGAVGRCQLPALAASVAGGGTAHPPLLTPSLFIPQLALHSLLSSAGECDGTRTDDLTAGQHGSALHVLLGDTSKISARAAVASASAATAPSRLASAWGLTREVDLNVPLQLCIIGELRAILLSPSRHATSSPAVSNLSLNGTSTSINVGNSPNSNAVSGSASGSEYSRASALSLRVRRYLQRLQAATGTATVPLPATLRGEVWGALLGVPSARARELAYGAAAAAPVRTAADRQIALDVARCHQYHPLLASEAGQAALQRTLKAWLASTSTPSPSSSSPPSLGYWQGADSACAVLLSVSASDEAMAAAQLAAVVRLFVSHGEGITTGGAAPDSTDPPFSLLCPSAHTPPSVAPPPPSPLDGRVAPATMEAALRQFAATLRYCDPLLSAHIAAVDCPPQLFAISWLLTLFAHSLPAAQVCLLWDFVFVHALDGPHCVACMCCAALMQRRAAVMGRDASGVLAVLGGGGLRSCGGDGDAAIGAAHVAISHTARSTSPYREAAPTGSGSGSGGGGATGVDVVLLLADTAALMHAVPPCIGRQPEDNGGNPHHDDDDDAGGNGAMRAGGLFLLARGEDESDNEQSSNTNDNGNTVNDSRGRSGPRVRWQAAVAASSVAFMDAATLLEALPRLPNQKQQQQQRWWWDSGLYLVDLRAIGGDTTEEVKEESGVALSNADGTSTINNANGSGGPTAGPSSDGGRVIGAMRIPVHEPSLQGIAQAAHLIMRQLASPAMAAAQPRLAAPSEAPATTDSSSSSATAAVTNGMDRRPAPSPPALTAARSPHVVLLTRGTELFTPDSSGGSHGTVDPESTSDAAMAEALALELARCGVHNVSVLLGGVEQLRRHAPWMIVGQRQKQ